MKPKNLIATFLIALIATISTQAQMSKDSTQNKISLKTEKKYQAKAPETQRFGKEAFAASNSTTIRWLGMAGFFINSHGKTIMIDPLLEEYDMPLLIKFPILARNVFAIANET